MTWIMPALPPQLLQMFRPGQPSPDGNAPETDSAGNPRSQS